MEARTSESQVKVRASSGRKSLVELSVSKRTDLMKRKGSPVVGDGLFMEEIVKKD